MNDRPPEMSRSECLELLAQTSIGRVVVATSDTRTPLIRPVNYFFDEPSQSVVFRTADGSKFHSLVHSARASFEIDNFDAGSRSGWSVIVAGVTEEVSRPADIRRLESEDFAPWAPGEKPHWIRIRARTVSGRRIVPEPAA